MYYTCGQLNSLRVQRTRCVLMPILFVKCILFYINSYNEGHATRNKFKYTSIIHGVVRYSLVNSVTLV